MKKQIPLTIKIATGFPDANTDAALALCVFTDEPRAAGDEALNFIKSFVADGEFKGEAETSLLIHAQGDAGEPRRLLLVGCGAHEDFNAASLNRAAGMAAREARSAHLKHLHLLLPTSEDEPRLARAVAEGALMGLYDGDFYQSDDDDDGAASLEKLTIIVSQNNDEIETEVERGRVIAEAANWTRALSDTPGRDLPPEEFARRAALMAEEYGLKVESLNADEIKARGMGGLYGVGKGSDEPPALIVIRYEPEGASETDELWAFVGKGITFDTGGISLKHGLDMYEMKTDMAGGAAVLGALRVIAQLKPKQRVVGIVPSAENMPSGRSIKPGDIVKTLAGYTIEVVDTDAEGRLVLSDGIAYAKQLGASRIVDLATLTGSIIMALGDHRTGLFSNDDEWANHVREAAERAGEPVWRMPVGDEYKKKIESAIADFKNYGGRPDATGAALLLSKFAGDTPWVHLDIAGTSWYDSPQPYAPQGSSGTGVRTLVELVCN
ncbi:MAG TPA: leucyl aminopeptidase [Pyrinomonadaceae bacterium]|jgi:leucyl aminopeptidase